MDETRRRPLGIWMIVGLELFNAAISILDATLGTTLRDPRFQELVGDGTVVRASVVVWAALVILACVLLWRLQRRGWALMMLLVGVSLVTNLLVWWSTPERTQWASMAVSIATVFYLNSAPVRGLFLTRPEVTRITLSDRADQ